jgi:hypothetical protein
MPGNGHVGFGGRGRENQRPQGRRGVPSPTQPPDRLRAAKPGFRAVGMS